MATLEEMMGSPLMYLGLGLMSSGARRPANQPGNTGAELMNALGMWQQQQQARQAMAQRQTQEQRLAQQFEMEKQQVIEAQNKAKQAQEREGMMREAVQNALRQNPNAAPGEIMRSVLQATGDPSLLGQLPEQKPLPMMNVPAGGVVFDPITRQPVFQNPPVAGSQQQRPQIITGADGVPRLITEGGRGSEAIPGFTPKPTAAAEPEEIEIAPGQLIRTRPLAPKERQALGGDVVNYQALSAELDRLATTAAQVMGHPGLPGISGATGAFPSLPGGNAYDAEKVLNSLKAQVFTNTLQAMRAASKTGGAVGNVSDKEGDKLERVLGNLEKAQKQGQLTEALQGVIDYAQSTKDRLGNAINVRYGAPQSRQAPAGAQPQGSPEDWVARAMRANPGMSREQVIEEGRRRGKIH